MEKMKSIEIRKAEIQDLEDLSLIFNEYRIFYKKPSDPMGAKEFLLDRFVNFQSHIFLAINKETNLIVGFTQLYPTFSSLSMGRAVILNDLYVREEFRRLGIAKSLLQSVKNYATLSNLKYIELSTAITNKKAQSLYESFGFERETEFYHYSLNV